MVKKLARLRVCLLSSVFALSASTVAQAQEASLARSMLEKAAEAMGGLERLQGLDNLVLSGFGQRVYMQGGGFITGEDKAPPKWQAVTDAQCTFDLQGERALNQERRAYEFPFAGFFGLNFARTTEVQTGDLLLDHPLPALLEALDTETRLGAVSTEDGAIVVQFTPEGSSSPAWIGINPRSNLPVFSRWITGSNNLGDITYTAYFTGYLPFDGVQLPMGLMNEMYWRNQVSLMFQVDSYRVNADEAEVPPAPVRTDGNAPLQEAQVRKLADGV
jgi:hypothetical protein